MAEFSLLDDDYGDSFITQSGGNDNVVSLEENSQFRTVKTEDYSNISDFEDDSRNRRLR